MIRLEHEPTLKKPVMVVGWADAGFVGMKAVSYLRTKLGAVSLGEIEPERFFSVPDSVIKNGVLETLEYPGNQFWYWRRKKLGSDLILFAGYPPAVGHHKLASLIIDVADQFGVNRVYTVGAIQATVAHTEVPKVLTVVNYANLKKLFAKYDVDSTTNYQGPTSMNGLILGVAKSHGLEGISLWGQVPHYIGEVPAPGITLAVLRILCKMLRLSIDFGELEVEADLAKKEVDKLIDSVRKESPDFDQYLKRLETGTLTKDEGDKFFREIDDFLKRQRE